MSDGLSMAIAAAAPASIQGPAAAGSAAQPTAQQAARFEQQLNLPPAETLHYELPAPDGEGLGGGWRAAVDGAGQIDRQFRTQIEAMNSHADATLDAGSLDSQEAGVVRVMQNTTEKACQLSYAMMNFSVVSSAEQMAGQSVRTLVQQA